jgi:integrase
MKIHIDSFVAWLKNKNLKDRTIEEYLYYFNKFVPYESFTQESIGKFLAKKENRNGVARAFLINLKKYVMVNYKEIGLDKDQRIEVSEIELPQISGRPKERLINPLTEEQVLHLEKFLHAEKEKIMLLASFYGALRAGELLKIRVSSFNWEDWKKDITQHGECRVYGKGDKEGVAFFPPALMKRIGKFIYRQGFPSLSSYIFLNKTETLEGIDIRNRMSNWERKLRIAGIRSGITKLDGNKKVIEETRVHPHKLRHSWADHLRHVLGADALQIMELLRHRSINSTQRYVRANKPLLKELLRSGENRGL